MEAVVIPRFLRASDLILQSKNDAFSVSNAKWSHSSRRTHSAWYAQLLLPLCLVEPQPTGDRLG